MIVFHDVSESRAMALEMAHLAQHDFLTSLPNRLLLTERFSHAIGMAQRNRKQVGLMFLDLDNFKHINDSLGHAIGDQLLQSVANRLVGCARTTDTVCRQGGDEFVILLAEISQPQDAAHVAATLRAALDIPHLIDGHELHISLSVGISIFPDDGTDVDTLMQNADTAMYHAKASGRNNYQFFKADMNTRAVRRLLVEGSLRRALKQGEFLLHYQPKIDLATGAMTGAEALIRWQDPHLGLVYPAQFVPIAEDNGLIVPVGRWVLREACRQVQAWLDSGLRAVPVAVNISAVEFRHEGFLDGVALILKETGLAPRYLQLELTESILMHDAESSESVLEALKAMGVKLAIDDFGTGYSSLSYLKRFPIDTLKIDQSFVRDIASDADDATIVAAIIGMGKTSSSGSLPRAWKRTSNSHFCRPGIATRGKASISAIRCPPRTSPACLLAAMTNGHNKSRTEHWGTDGGAKPVRHESARALPSQSRLHSAQSAGQPDCQFNREFGFDSALIGRMRQAAVWVFRAAATCRAACSPTATLPSRASAICQRGQAATPPATRRLHPRSTQGGP